MKAVNFHAQILGVSSASLKKMNISIQVFAHDLWPLGFQGNYRDSVSWYLLTRKYRMIKTNKHKIKNRTRDNTSANHWPEVHDYVNAFQTFRRLLSDDVR